MAAVPPALPTPPIPALRFHRSQIRPHPRPISFPCCRHRNPSSYLGGKHCVAADRRRYRRRGLYSGRRVEHPQAEGDHHLPTAPTAPTATAAAHGDGRDEGDRRPHAPHVVPADAEEGEPQTRAHILDCNRRGRGRRGDGPKVNTYRVTDGVGERPRIDAPRQRGGQGGGCARTLPPPS